MVSKNVINVIQNNEDIDFNEGFLEDELDRLQATLFYLMDKVQLVDIVEIWELIRLTRIYKHYIILLADGVEIITQFQHINNNPMVIKHCGQPATKRIKVSFENDMQYSRTNNSILSLSDLNLHV
ncbi:2255_t:CDS:2 [Dentiscutata erythropus]|uniref:2255_t:CDS:1 n=1 Tax=Dentiscutata erythropus TaxID=1348616 RepID=A0A9N8YPB8_9GLOM|nr:2255_t:CDS:2 [Dentiscutata erythropus]